MAAQSGTVDGGGGAVSSVRLATVTAREGEHHVEYDIVMPVEVTKAAETERGGGSGVRSARPLVAHEDSGVLTELVRGGEQGFALVKGMW